MRGVVLTAYTNLSWVNGFVCHRNLTCIGSRIKSCLATHLRRRADYRHAHRVSPITITVDRGFLIFLVKHKLPRALAISLSVEFGISESHFLLANDGLLRAPGL